jgi:hypothetical protein
MENRSSIENIRGQKVVVVNTLNGSINVTLDAIRENQALKRKRWRPLYHYHYPSLEFERDLATNLPAHLAYNLYRTHLKDGYTDFTSAIEINDELIDGQSGKSFNLYTQDARFVGAIDKMVRKLRSGDDDAAQLQQSMNETLIQLQKEWSLRVQLQTNRSAWPYRFLLDSESFNISVAPLAEVSANPADYPNRVRTTSELFPFLFAQTFANFIQFDLDKALEFLPLAKLVLRRLDGKSFLYNSIRVCVDDVEEWDYIDSEAEDELTIALQRTGVAPETRKAR